MRSRTCLLVLLSVLFMNVERAIDLACTTHAESDEHSYSLDLSTTDQPAEADDGAAADHCSHCLHAHLAGVFAAETLSAVPAHDDAIGTSRYSLNGYLRSPPTPPPNS